jgi:thiamine-phosphate pyrophosphorylase
MASEPLRAKLAAARLYLVCGARPGGRDPGPFLDAALRGGVDVVQLRAKEAADDEVLEAAGAFRAACDAHGGVPFILNDRADLVAAANADGVHVGQDDMPVAEARELVGAGAIVGRSTHTPAQVDEAGTLDVDYFAVGPVHATPTKPGRPAAGLELVRHASSQERRRNAGPPMASREAMGPPAKPWFAIGGIDASTVGDVLAAGARRIVVVRAIELAEDPEAAARTLRARLEEAPVGAA